MTEKELKEFYNTYWQETPIGLGYDGYIRAGKCLEEILDFDSVLDVGTGNGEALKIFLSAGKKAMGIEYSGWLFNELLRKIFVNGEVIEADAAKLPFGNDSFDLVFSSDVLEHLPEEKAKQAIREMYRVTKKYFYGSIGSEIDERKKYHLTIKPINWWKEEFENVGFIPIKIDERIYIYRK
jgi:ubiquinone/menaquinone biosynthesis C-methylase UbiE